MNAFIRSRDRRVRLVERRLADRADDLRLEVRGPGGVAAAPRPTAASATRATRTPRAAITRARPRRRTRSARARPARSPPRRTPARPSLAVDHERLRESGHAVAVDRVAWPVVDERERELVAAARSGVRLHGSPSRRARRRRRLDREFAANLLEVRRLLLARHAPRRPDVRARRPCRAARRAGAAVPVEALEREVGRARPVAPVRPLREVAALVVQERPRKQE